ncbi:hypothetical protein HID58_009747 [Brassica napus]|uniref:Uncharacterized protein n=1 Tax=Brassica napus TaxID=3708 RepID=A0ABQ8DTE6_BRANA|nr:hypothetical protein HID58_009747 [Brassica napus]
MMSGLATVAVGHTFDTVKGMCWKCCPFFERFMRVPTAMVTWLTWGNIGVLTGGLGGKAQKENHYPDKANETNTLKVLRSIYNWDLTQGCYADLGPTILRVLVLEPNRHLMSFLVT